MKAGKLNLPDKLNTLCDVVVGLFDRLQNEGLKKIILEEGVVIYEKDS